MFLVEITEVFEKRLKKGLKRPFFVYGEKKGLKKGLKRPFLVLVKFKAFFIPINGLLYKKAF